MLPSNPTLFTKQPFSAEFTKIAPERALAGAERASPSALLRRRAASPALGRSRSRPIYLCLGRNNLRRTLRERNGTRPLSLA
jgi:hypothetical protein